MKDAYYYEVDAAHRRGLFTGLMVGMVIAICLLVAALIGVLLLAVK